MLQPSLGAEHVLGVMASLQTQQLTALQPEEKEMGKGKEESEKLLCSQGKKINGPI